MPVQLVIIFAVVSVIALILAIVAVSKNRNLIEVIRGFVVDQEKQHEKLQAQITDLSAELASQHDRILRLSETVTSETRLLHNTITSLRDRTEEDLATIRNTTKEEITSLSDTINSAQTKADLLRDAVAAHQQRLGKLAIQVNALQNNNNTHFDTTKKLSEDLQKTNTAVSEINNELRILRREIQTLQGTFSPKSINPSLPEPVKPTPEEENDFPEEKQTIFHLMEHTSQNLLITGKGGTGKSYLLKYFMAHTKKKPVYCAPTGLAAINIHGVTLHSFFQFNNLQIGAQPHLDNRLKAKLKAVSVLVIDEISMVNADVFETIDQMFRIADPDHDDLPFAGRQIILFGDLFQLPPIIKREENRYMQEHYSGIFFFNAPAFLNGGFSLHELQKVYRYKKNDPVNLSFIETLDRIREGNQTPDDITFLNQRVLEIPVQVPLLTALREAAHTTNYEELNKLRDFDSFFYRATITLNNPYRVPLTDRELETLQKSIPCELNLELKIGALVMMVSNDPAGRWVNGTIGKVFSLSDDHIIVEIYNQQYDVEKAVFEQTECKYDPVLRELKYTPVITVTQYPLILAYAITIHKSQGQTYERVACDVHNCFDPGQAYVALSRCADYNELYLTEEIKSNTAFAAPEVIRFYKEHITH